MFKTFYFGSNLVWFPIFKRINSRIERTCLVLGVFEPETKPTMKITNKSWILA